MHGALYLVRMATVFLEGAIADGTQLVGYTFTVVIFEGALFAVAIGYQDIVSIANTTLNQTGQAIEGIAIIMLVYLTISLSISLFMNWYNARIALVER